MAKDEENPGVSYEFYIPRTGKEVLFIPEVSMVNGRQAELRSGGIGESLYFWSYGGWTACSTDCGTGEDESYISYLYIILVLSFIPLPMLLVIQGNSIIMIM